MTNKRLKFHIASAHIAADKKVTLTTVVIGTLIIVLGIILRSWRTAGMDASAYMEAISSVPFWGKLHRLGSEEGLTLYLSQLSFTFITISVMSVLSDSSVVIYWENIVKKKLIEPVWSCFHAYTTYSFATVIFGGIAALIGLPFIFLLFFVTDIIVLMALTFSMIDVYFRHDEKARKLEKEFRELVSFREAPTDELKQDYEKYLNITSKLRTNTIVALKEHDSPTLEENFRFYARNAAYIPKRDFETIVKCVDEINIFDFTEWLDYYTRISYPGVFYDGSAKDEISSGSSLLAGIPLESSSPDGFQAQLFISEVMCKSKDLFDFVLDSHILPLFAEVSDSVSAESIFCDYKYFKQKQRETLKKVLGERYDRKRNGPANAYNTNFLLRSLLEVMKKGKRDFLMSFLHAFQETNMLTNYDYNESDEAVWEEYFETIPEDEAYDRLDEIYPITEILYGTKYPECVKQAVRFAWGNFDDFVSGGFQKSDKSFAGYEAYESEDDELEFADEEDDLLEELENEESDIYEDLSEEAPIDEELDEEELNDEESIDEDLDEEYDDWEYYCKVYDQEYVGWPPENDHCGLFTYEGRWTYGMSSQHGELNDGDLPK